MKAKGNTGLKEDEHAASAAIDPARYVVKVNGATAIVGFIFFSLAAAITGWMFLPFVPQGTMLMWSVSTALFLAVWLILNIVFVLRKPSDQELIRFWAGAAFFVRVTSNLVVLATIWMFFPHGPYPLQLVMTVFYVAHVPTQVLTLPSSSLINGLGASLILGSLIVVTVMEGGDYAAFVALFVAGFLVAMILLGIVVGRLINTVMQARRASDEAALKLEVAVAAVAAERDAKTRFIAAASHDLGQPLQAASLFFDQVVRAPDAPARAKAAEGVRKAFASAEQLLSHMLGFLRLEADRVEPIRVRVALDPLLKRVAEQAAPIAQERGVDIRRVPTGHVLLLDPALLERALSNLLANAVAHSGGTRVLLGVRQAEAGRLRVWVIDDGVGIGQADAAHVFNDFYQGSDSRAPFRSGFGLGLGSVRRIAQLMEGEAALDSRWLGGAAFFLDFPDPALARRTDIHSAIHTAHTPERRRESV